MKYYKLNKDGYIKFLGLDVMPGLKTPIIEKEIKNKNFIVKYCNGADFCFTLDEINKMKNKDIYPKLGFESLTEKVNHEIENNPIVFVNRKYEDAKSLMHVDLIINNEEITVMTMARFNINFLNDNLYMKYFDEITEKQYKNIIVKDSFK
ncbi:hypothetical protein UFVDC4_00170 [Staphylococcus phage vB_SauM-UFV_DC4]|nr:hypothetical protein UFVDC4_00170 [Staphylococcus phage vB_SauM-UFV_DC4]